MKKSSRAGRRVALAAVVATMVMLVAACGGGSSTGTIPGASGPAKTGDTILGAGASFPAPLYSKWGSDYNGVSGIKLNYQSIGSGGGISAIKAKTVDFGASDAPLEQADLESSGLAQFPMVVGGVVLVVNIEGVADGQLKLTPDAVAGIFMGTITSWDDPAITAANPGLKLPAGTINVVHRSDGSGTTWIFTHYLTAAAGDVWTAGADKEIAWPIGVGGKGNEGVAASVQQLSGSIGYVEYAYAKQTGMATTQLQNKDGMWVKPSHRHLRRRRRQRGLGGQPAEHVRWCWSTSPGKQSWPITGASFILVQKEQADAARAKTMLDVLRLGLHERRGRGHGARLRADPGERLQDRPGAGLADDHRRRRARLAVTVKPCLS